MDNARESEIRKLIDAYVKGQLSEDEIQALWDEFAKYPEFLDVLEVETGLKALVSEKKGEKAVVHKLSNWTWYAAAAAVILIVALVQVFRINTPTELDDFMVHNITPDQIETADGVRTDDLGMTTADSLLNLGFEAVITGDEERALELFNEVINKYDKEPYGSKAHLNKGIVLYNESNYEEAVQSFRESAKRADHSRMISEKAYWYLGNALINIGNLEEAREAIYEAYQMDGVFRNASFRLLQKLNYDLGMYDYEDFETQQLN